MQSKFPPVDLFVELEKMLHICYSIATKVQMRAAHESDIARNLGSKFMSQINARIMASVRLWAKSSNNLRDLCKERACRLKRHWWDAGCE